jgi:hypothetical protein
MANNDPRLDRPQTCVKSDGPNWTTKWNIGGVGDRAGVPFNSADASAAAAVTAAPVDAANSLVIDDVTISVGAAMNVKLQEETSTNVVFGPYYFAAAGSLTITGLNSRGKKMPTAGKKLMVKASVSGNITVDVAYHEEA